jgi:hypothetical protein
MLEKATMQLIEASEIGVRAAIVRLTSRKAKLVWLMFPMIHLGERAYYRQVEEKMAVCDVVLAEGVDSQIANALTMSYRLAANSDSGTVVQRPTKPATDHMVVQHADMSGSEFDAAWQRMPIGLRLGIPLMAPLYGLWLRFVANPEEWHSKLQTDDLPTNDEVLLEGEYPALFKVLFHDRHEHLFHQIDAVQQRWGGLDRVAGVAWGAKHIGAVTEYLSNRWGYIARSADWVTVFDYTK